MRERCYAGVWSNGKTTIDLDNLNTVAEITSICSCVDGRTDGGDEYYATKSGTIIHKYHYDDLEDWFADLGPIYNRHNCYEVMGKNFKKIKDKGEADPNWIEFMKWSEEENKR